MEGNKVARQKVWVFSFALFPANQPSHCLLLTSIRPCIHPSISVPPLLIYSEWQCVGREGHPVGDCHTHTAIITSAVQQKTSHHLRLTSPSSSFFILINFYFCLHVPPPPPPPPPLPPPHLQVLFTSLSSSSLSSSFYLNTSM